MSNHAYLAPILQATDTDAIDGWVDAQPPVQAARDMLTAVDQDVHTWTEKLAICRTDSEHATARTRDLHAQREPLLVPARVDGAPGAIAQLAPLTAALTVALVDADDAAATLRLVQDKHAALASARVVAERRMLEARLAALNALTADAAATADAQLVAAADASARHVALATLSGALAMRLGIPYERHPRRRVEMAVAFAFHRIYREGTRGAPLAGHVHATPAADAFEWEQARQAAEPAAPAEEPAAVAADGWTKRATW